MIIMYYILIILIIIINKKTIICIIIYPYLHWSVPRMAEAAMPGAADPFCLYF